MLDKDGFKPFIEKINGKSTITSTEFIQIFNQYDKDGMRKILSCSLYFSFFYHKTVAEDLVQKLTTLTVHCRKVPSRSTGRNCFPQVSFKIAGLKNFAIFTGKHLCWSLFLIKLQAFRPPTSLKGDSNKGVFLYILQNILRAAFL